MVINEGSGVGVQVTVGPDAPEMLLRLSCSLLAPGTAEPVRVTTDAAYYEENPESLELWSLGNSFFTSPELLANDDEPRAATT